MRVAIGVIFVSLLGGSWSAEAMTAADNAAAYAKVSGGGSAGMIANTQQDARSLPGDAAGRAPATGAKGVKNAQLKNVKAAAANDDRRLASLDPSQIVYSQTAGYAANYSQGFAQVPVAQASLLDLSNSRLFPRQDLRPAALHHARSFEDFVLMGFVAVMLIVYQLRKKHRFLRPHPFSY